MDSLFGMWFVVYCLWFTAAFQFGFLAGVFFVSCIGVSFAFCLIVVIL